MNDAACWQWLRRNVVGIDWPRSNPGACYLIFKWPEDEPITPEYWKVIDKKVLDKENEDVIRSPGP